MTSEKYTCLRILYRAHGIGDETPTEQQLVYAEAHLRYRWHRHGEIRSRAVVEESFERKLRSDSTERGRS
jgi:hypothetical protein